MASLQNFYTSRDNNANADSYVGQLDRLWYNPNLNSIYVSDGNTPGGIPVGLATGADAIFGNITVNGNVLSDLNVNGNISPAADNKIGGIAPGPGVFISNQGILTIDSANLPVSFGNFTANNNILTIVNVNEDMILQTDGNAEIQLIGNVGFYKPNGLPPNVANRFAYFSSDGQIQIIAATPDNLEGAVKITGNDAGIFQTPVVAGVMLQITGQPNIGGRIYTDSSNARGLLVGRRFNGTDASPTPVLDNEEIYRIAATGYPGNAWPTTGSAQIRFIAEGNQSSTNQGGRIEFTAVPVGDTAVTTILTLNAANGASATKFTTSGTVNATGNITGGNITTPGTIRYDIGSDNATVTQLTSKSTAVTANGRTGQITGNAAALAQGTSVTFTVNNTFVSANDTIILNIKSGATADTYTYNVSAVNSGSFNIQLRNFTNTSRSDAVVFNFAVIKVS